MKMKPEHFDYLKSRIAAVLEKYPHVQEQYRKGIFPRSDACKNVQGRFNNDLLRAAVPSSWVCDNLYPYLNDKHIGTALKAICPVLDPEEAK